MLSISGKKRDRIEKIVLYGSYARRGWVDEPHTAKGYKSAFDLLIIVNDKRLTDRVDYWLEFEDWPNRELAITKALRTPATFIVHALQEVKDGLALGRYFSMDVRHDGFALYEFTETELYEPKLKAPDQALTMEKEYFEDWMPAGSGMLETAMFSQRQGRPKHVAFLMQTTECLYHCVLLVVTFCTSHVYTICSEGLTALEARPSVGAV